MTKAITYARISPRPDAEESESIEFQIEECAKYAQAQGMEVVETFSDHAMSGGNPDRPGLIAAHAALKKGWVLLVYKLDRLARDLLLAEQWRLKIENDGARIYAVSGGGNDISPTGVLMRQFIEANAEFNRNNTRQLTSQAMLRHQKTGRRMSYIPPYGWAVDPQDRTRLVEEWGEQMVIERIMELRGDGLGYRAIARELEKQGLDCRGRKNWYHAQIGKILKRAMAL